MNNGQSSGAASERATGLSTMKLDLPACLVVSLSLVVAVYSVFYLGGSKLVLELESRMNKLRLQASLSFGG